MTEHNITHLGIYGDGIAEGPVFAPTTLPGEVVSGVLDGSTLTDVKIISPADDRVAAPCRHFKACGGCQLQHASDRFVADWKTDLVAQALAAQGLSAEIRPIVTSPAKSRRRATFAARRTKKGTMSGFHGRASGTVVEIPDCQLVEPELLAARPIAEALAVIGGSRKATLAVTVTTSPRGLDVQVSGGKPLDGPLRIALAGLCESRGFARLTWEDEVIAQRSPPVQRFGAADVCPPPGAFMQATAHGEAQLLAAVQEAVHGAKRVVDLFAGCGTFTLPLAQNAEVLAVEGEAQMVEAMDKGWRMAKGLKTVTHAARDLYRRPLLPDEFKKFDAVVLDPPRSGAEAQTAELIRSDIKRIAYVSCNPISFARDVAQMVAAGFTLDWVQPVDQFRWSSHVELAAQISRA
ncbi:class I SAM-dependent RNA methyltransferase [Sulfitobacter donghicola]|uniref:RNA methyltransferase n=1 Tax=Sulfitobacter donghicola DSW-25 = KCTC 12864 = JCM 14565 TaxID=1300350 RepID=A0A073ILR0_9RHOB|nr:RsmD family RNA methyltransferase [Sulfitobacter donghicola]KEJ90674.1 RNA methyltransferase [Sulfitobacter donghicola DSW-25 = KCTC 12864 = JCM 14565]KIN67925.1 23S rRNA (Uracil-5-)-methyltransferase [Sulfitobacter donghicola DSW-25 = KCTC 12864 = JCM 14565]